MLRHIVTWNYKDGFTDSENKENTKTANVENAGLKRYSFDMRV